MDLKNFTNLDIYTSELGNNMIHIHFPAEHLSVDQFTINTGIVIYLLMISE